MKSRGVGRRITAQEKEYFRKGIKTFYMSSAESSLKIAFQKTLLEFFAVGYETRNGISTPILPALEDLPTFRQFCYLYNKEFASELTIQSKQSRNRPAFLQSRRGMEADLLPNPALDCNPNASLLRGEEADLYLIKDLTDRESRWSEESD